MADAFVAWLHPWRPVYRRFAGRAARLFTGGQKKTIPHDKDIRDQACDRDHEGKTVKSLKRRLFHA